MVGPPLISTDALPALRRDMKTLRRKLHNEGKWQPAPFDRAISNLFRYYNFIGLYAPMSGEPDPALIMDALGKTTARPALLADGTMVFRQWAANDPVIPSSWGGSQPGDAAPIVEPDVIFVPLVAFDRSLNRVGQGGGHYDRYLAARDGALRIGVAWEGQRVDSLPVQHWDIPLDAVITEQNCYVKELRPCLIR
jgi:5-formyltetrahydrofolate cyclo-ligase